MNAKPVFRHPRSAIAAGLLTQPGFMLWYLLPLAMTLWYALIQSPFDHQFVGDENFKSVIGNKWFRLGAGNFALIGGCAILCGLALVLAMAPLLLRHPRIAEIGASVLILPLLIPSISAVTLWQGFFQANSVLKPWAARLCLLTLFLWKTTGSCAVLLYTALRRIPTDILDAAELDGAGGWRCYFAVQLPLCGRGITLSLMLLAMYLTRIYKESYLLFGKYPGKDLYLLQHYMNHQYENMSFQHVAAAAALLTACALCLYAAILALSGKRRCGR